MKSIRSITALTLAAALLVALPFAASAGEGGDKDVTKKRQVHTITAVASDEHPQVFVQGFGDAPMIVDVLHGRGYLGVELTGLTPELRRHFGAPEEAGVMVGRVEEDSPAAAAGLLVGDIVTAIDGEPIRSAAALAAGIRRHEEGDEVTVTVYRDRQPLDFEVTVTERDRQAVDLGYNFHWRRHAGEEGEEGEGPEEFFFRGVDPDKLPRLRGTVEIQPELFEQMAEHLDEIDWQNLPRLRDQTLLKRLEELEARLKQLEEELEEARQGNQH